jgi:hypothetical protein
MQNTKLEAIKQECLTLAHGLQMQQTSISNAITNLEYIRQMLEKLASAVDEACIGLNAPPPVQTKPDPSDRDLISEWVSDFGGDWNDDFEEAVTAELDVNHYSTECSITITKEVESYNRDSILEEAIERYLEWVSQQTIETQQEGEGDA